MAFYNSVEILWRRRAIVIAVLLAGVAVALIINLRVPTSYQGSAHVLMVNQEQPDPSLSTVDLPSVATSSVVLSRVRTKLHLSTSVPDLQHSISARVIGKSGIMAISYRDTSTERAMAVPNAVAHQLSQYYNELSTHRYNFSVSNLNRELAAQQQHFHALDQRLRRLAAQDPFVISDKSVDDVTEHLSDLQMQRATAYAVLTADSASAQIAAAEKTVRHDVLQDDPYYRNLRDIAGRDAAKLAEDRARYTAAYPGLPGEREKVQKELSILGTAAAQATSAKDAYSPSSAAANDAQEHAAAVVLGDKARVALLDQLIAEQQRRLHDVPLSGMSFSELRAQRDAAQAGIVALSGRLAAALADRAEAASLGSVVVVDEANEADTREYGGRARLMIVELLLSLALAIGLPLLIESVDPRLHHAQKVEELYGHPVIANLGRR